MALLVFVAAVLVSQASATYPAAVSKSRFQFSKIKGNGNFQSGYNRGNPWHWISRLERTQGPTTHGKVEWWDSSGGSGRHVWELNHVDKGEGHWHTENRPSYGPNIGDPIDNGGLGPGGFPIEGLKGPYIGDPIDNGGLGPGGYPIEGLKGPYIGDPIDNGGLGPGGFPVEGPGRPIIGDIVYDGGVSPAGFSSQRRVRHNPDHDVSVGSKEDTNVTNPMDNHNNGSGDKSEQVAVDSNLLGENGLGSGGFSSKVRARQTNHDRVKKRREESPTLAPNSSQNYRNHEHKHPCPLTHHIQKRSIGQPPVVLTRDCDGNPIQQRALLGNRIITLTSAVPTGSYADVLESSPSYVDPLAVENVILDSSANQGSAPCVSSLYMPKKMMRSRLRRQAVWPVPVQWAPNVEMDMPKPVEFQTRHRPIGFNGVMNTGPYAPVHSRPTIITTGAGGHLYGMKHDDHNLMFGDNSYGEFSANDPSPNHKFIKSKIPPLPPASTLPPPRATKGPHRSIKRPPLSHGAGSTTGADPVKGDATTNTQKKTKRPSPTPARPSPWPAPPKKRPKPGGPPVVQVRPPVRKAKPGNTQARPTKPSDADDDDDDEEESWISDLLGEVLSVADDFSL